MVYIEWKGIDNCPVDGANSVSWYWMVYFGFILAPPCSCSFVCVMAPCVVFVWHVLTICVNKRPKPQPSPVVCYTNSIFSISLLRCHESSSRHGLAGPIPAFISHPPLPFTRSEFCLFPWQKDMYISRKTYVHLAQMASNAENVSIWWRHHVLLSLVLIQVYTHTHTYIYINIFVSGKGLK